MSRAAHGVIGLILWSMVYERCKVSISDWSDQRMQTVGKKIMISYMYFLRLTLMCALNCLYSLYSVRRELSNVYIYIAID